MRGLTIFGSGVLLLGMAAGWQMGYAKRAEMNRQAPQDTDKVAPIPAEDAAKKNPVKPNAEGMAAAKKLYGYHCAMCHGKEGDGKGELAEDMKLTLKDWRDPAALANTTDGEMFYIITNGRGKMAGGEGDRTKEEVRWNLVNYVRSLAKK